MGAGKRLGAGLAVAGLVMAAVLAAASATSPPSDPDGPSRAGAAAGTDGRGLCARRPQLSPFASEVREAIRMRREVGFRADRAYVKRLQRRRPGRRVALTGAERAYMRLRGRLTRAVPRAVAYLEAQPPTVSGGVSIEDAPGRPHVVVRVTRDAAAHQARLRERFPYPDHIDAVEVSLSERELADLSARIVADRDALAVEGYRVEVVGVDTRANAVAVDLITRRRDAPDHFRERYGDTVLPRVLARRPTRLECRSPDRYRQGRNGRVLRIEWLAGPSRVVRTHVREGRRRVAIGVVERVSNGAVRRIGVPRSARVVLRRPLGSRKVVGATTGRPVSLMRGRSGRRHR